MSDSKKKENSILEAAFKMLERVPGKIKTRINLLALIILVVFLAIVFITPFTEVYRFTIILAFIGFAGIMAISIVRSERQPIHPQGEDFQVIDMFEKVELLRNMIREAKSVDLICSSSITFYDTYKDVIKESKPNTNIFLRKWWPGFDYHHERVNRYRKNWEDLNVGADRPFVSTKLHKNDTLRGLIISQPKRTYGIFGFYIWRNAHLNALKSSPKAMYVTDETELGKYLIDVYRNRLDKISTLIYQAQILLEDIYLYSDCMSPEFLQGTLLHSQRVYSRILELAPYASDALQIAGLAHDIDRAFKSREVKQEDYPDKYDKYKEQHAIRSAEIIGELLTNSGFDSKLAKRVEFLVRNHENGENTGDSEIEILKAADSLTFFEYDVEAYDERSGPEATKAKMIYMYNKLSSEYKAKIDEMLLKKPRIKKLFEEALSPGEKEKLWYSARLRLMGRVGE